MMGNTLDKALGNRRMASDYQRNVRIVVNKITSPVLGAEVRKVEDRGRLSEHDRTKIKFLKAAINFLPMAMDDGADLRNALFIFAQPGREFTVKAGKGDWEYYFSEEGFNNITGKCVHRPTLRFIWNGITSTVSRLCGPLLSLGSAVALALTAA